MGNGKSVLMSKKRRKVRKENSTITATWDKDRVTGCVGKRCGATNRDCKRGL